MSLPSHFILEEMDSDYNEKIVRVLKKLLEPDFKISNDVYLNSLITHLTSDPGDGCNNSWRCATKEYLPSWITEAVGQWEKLRLSSSGVVSFTLNLASFICKDESTFVLLNSRNVYERLIKVISVNKPTTAPTVKHSYIKLISSFLQHKSGLQWIISTNYWAEIMCLALRNETLYITKQGYEFIAELLVKSISLNEGFSLNVIQLIMAPLKENAPLMPPNILLNAMEVRDQAIYQSLCSTLSFLTEILQIHLENVLDENHCRVLKIFVDKFNLEEQIKSLLLIAQNDEFVFDLYRILFITSLFDMFVQLSGKTSMLECSLATEKSSKLLKVFVDNVRKGSVINILKLTYIGYIYWKKIGHTMPVYVRTIDNPIPLLFENQLLMLQLYPIIAVSLKVLGEREAEKKLFEDEVRDHYVDKILSNSTQPIVRIFFEWKNYLMNNPYMFEDATLTLNYLIKSRVMFTRDQAITSFQTLIYCFQDIINVLKEHSEQIMVFAKECNYMALLLDVIAMLISEFNFTWRDSLESICVMNLSIDFLSILTWPTKLMVKGLKLLDISISKYLTPNMALLIDNIHDSAMVTVGPMLYSKLHDSQWEVRDTALEVLCTVSDNANSKFPSFRDIVLGADLPSLILKMALLDGESFVRATAVKCLQKMVEVHVFWDNLLSSDNIHERIIQILQKETEGIVRKEAASLVATIYDYREIPSEVTTQYYDIMTHASTADLHWEVKVNALKFWEKVIYHHLTHQGMIDGTFPKVTFSKENRKIVTLDEPEVKKRLVKTLHQLSETGCLAVLLTAMQDDCDLEVSKTATEITQCFVSLLKRYNVQSSDTQLSTPPSPITSFNTFPTPPYSSARPSISMENPSPLSQCSQNSPQGNLAELDDITELILDEIINAQDMSLLQGVYNADDNNMIDLSQLRFRRVVMPSDFLKFVYEDFESHANDKAKWLREIDAFGSLLDDILKEYDNSDVNSMDCY